MLRQLCHVISFIPFLWRNAGEGRADGRADRDLEQGIEHGFLALNTDTIYFKASIISF